MSRHIHRSGEPGTRTQSSFEQAEPEMRGRLEPLAWHTPPGPGKRQVIGTQRNCVTVSSSVIPLQSASVIAGDQATPALRYGFSRRRNASQNLRGAAKAVFHNYHAFEIRKANRIISNWDGQSLRWDERPGSDSHDGCPEPHNLRSTFLTEPFAIDRFRLTFLIRRVLVSTSAPASPSSSPAQDTALSRR